MSKPLQKKISKGAKKKFFEVDIPLTSAKVSIYGYSPEMLEGSVINLDLTKNLRGKNLELKSRVKLEKDKLVGEIMSLELNKQYIRKVIRKGTDYIEDSIPSTCKDAEITIKTFMLTRNKVPRSIRNSLREQAKKYIMTKTKIRDSEELFNEIMTNKLQKELSLKLKKIYPLALCEIRTIKINKRIVTKKESSEKQKEEQ